MPEKCILVAFGTGVPARKVTVNQWSEFYQRLFISDKVLNDQMAFGKFRNKTLNYYFSSNQGSCSSQVEKYF